MTSQAPPSRTAPNTFMPPRGKRPGHKIGRNGLRYWIARQVVTNTLGYPDPCIALPVGADEDTINQLCHDYTADLRRWIEQRTAPDPEQPAEYDPRKHYDGSIKSICRIYQEHPFSDFHTVKSNTRRFYTANLKIVQADVGRRQAKNLTIVDFKRWYGAWRQPIDADDPNSPERVDRAHDCIACLRTAIYFCAALRLPHCEELAGILEKLKFEKGGSREQELTYEQVAAFIRTALELGAKAVIPPLRALYAAIGVATQFECMLRQKDAIGEYPKNQADLDKAMRRGAAVLNCGGRVWAGYFTWENIPGWRWHMRTSKSRYRSAQTFDLTRKSLLFPLLDQVPFEERHGAVIKGDGGHPPSEHAYRKLFRRIARVASIPDEVWNYDARAGGATESDEAGAPLELISTALTHSKQETTLRYIRRRSTKVAKLDDLRSAHRTAKEGEQK
jgi:hypothetical protein